MTYPSSEELSAADARWEMSAAGGVTRGKLSNPSQEVASPISQVSSETPAKNSVPVMYLYSQHVIIMHSCKTLDGSQNRHMTCNGASNALMTKPACTKVD